MKFFLFALIISSSFILAQNTGWETKFEKSGFFETSRYEETMEYFQRLADSSEYAEFFAFGTSPQGRELNAIIVSKEQEFTPADAKKSGKPLVLIINGIHSGEIEGKDACMLLLREFLITKEKESMLDNVNLLIVPIFSVDGHERFSKYSRINQNGPTEMGWRTTAQNLNLNRDWMKADAPEMQAMLELFSEWLPDFFVDTHTTDGADYQYNVTYGMSTQNFLYKDLAKLNKNEFLPFLKKRVEDAGYLITSYVSLKNWAAGLDSGITDEAAPPRFSTIYSAIQNRPGLLVETHMLKPYKERVFSTKTILEAVIDFSSQNAEKLVEMNKEADKDMAKKYSKKKNYYPLNFGLADTYVTEKFAGKAYKKVQSEISGTEKIVYSDKDTMLDVKVYRDVFVKDSVQAPEYYLIPKEWKEIVDRMKLHGIKVTQLKQDEELEVTRYRFINVKFASEPYEGRQRVNFDTESFKETLKVPAGTYKVKAKQRTIAVILHLLEPVAEDSFVKWGFFNGVFEQKEYFENYVMEKMAEEMLANDPELKKEFEKKLSEDEQFRSNSNARLYFFYQRTGYIDKNYRVYPVMRVE